MTVLCAALLLPVTAGCATGPSENRAFSQEWAREMGRSGARERPSNDNNGVVVGDEDGVRVEMDNGRPRIRMGENGGLEADVDVRGGRPAGGLGYTWEW